MVLDIMKAVIYWNCISKQNCSQPLCKLFECAQDFHSKSLHEPLCWRFHVFIQIRGKVSVQSLPPEVFKERITDIFSMAENERCIIQPLLTEVVGSNLLKYFKSFFCLRQNLCLSELLLENWNSSACFSSLDE